MSSLGLAAALKADPRTLRRRQTAAYFSAFVALGLTVGSLGPTVPSLAKQTNAGLNEIAYLFTARSLGFVLGALRGGKLFDRISGNRVLAAVLFLMAVTMSLVPLASKLAILIVAMLLLGAAESMLDTGANTLLLWVHRKRAGPFMNVMHSLFGAGALIAPLIVAQVELFGYAATHSYFILALALTPLTAYVLSTPSPLVLTRAEDESDPATDRRLVFLLSVFLFLYVGAEVGFAGWIFTYAVEFGLTTATIAAYLTSAFWGSLTLGRLLTAPLAARVKPRNVLLGSLGCALFSLLLMMSSPRSLAVILIGTIGLGFSLASIFPTAMTYASSRMRMTGHVTGRFLVASSAGSMIIPFAIGRSFQTQHPHALPLIVSLALAFALGVLLLIVRDELSN